MHLAALTFKRIPRKGQTPQCTNGEVYFTSTGKMKA
jgi:hypothetical protein